MGDTNGIGDSGFAALKDLLALRPNLCVAAAKNDLCLPWDPNNPPGEGQRAYAEAQTEAWDRLALEGYVPQSAAEDAPKVVLVRVGDGTEVPLVLEHAGALARGERAPLTLRSHPGKAVVLKKTGHTTFTSRE